MNYKPVKVMDATSSEASGSSFTAVLCAADIPGAELSKPFDKHTVAALRWWLLCRGIKAPSSWKKAQLIERYKNIQH